MFSFVIPDGVTDVIVRVAALALGMDPLLTVLDSDGQSVVATGTLDKDSTVAGYLAVPVKVTAGKTLYTKVEHRESSTGIYSVSVGAPIVLDEHIIRDSDGDGIEDDSDLCPQTAIPEIVPTSGVLKPNHWALSKPQNEFVQAPPQAGAKYHFTTKETGGCSCTQIINNLGIGKAQLRDGCSTSVMLSWVASVDRK